VPFRVQRYGQGVHELHSSVRDYQFVLTIAVCCSHSILCSIEVLVLNWSLNNEESAL
jgi:hypothetical protein